METTLFHDPLWPRAGGWPSADVTGSTGIDLALIGVPTYRTSLSPTGADATPAAIRAALRRYSGHVVQSGSRGERGAEEGFVIDEALKVVDAGDVDDPDSDAGETLATSTIAALASRSTMVVAS